MPSTRVIQNQGVASLVEKVDIDKILEPHSDEPLARFTMVKFVKTGLTAIGFSQYHTIGRFSVYNETICAECFYLS